MSDPGSSMIDEFREEIDPIVFAFGALLTVGVIAAFFISPSAVENGISSLNNQLLGAFNWAMMLIVFLIVLFLLFLIVGPWGGIKFGDEPPSTVFSPFSMLYSAGFAAGVVFWGRPRRCSTTTTPHRSSVTSRGGRPRR